MPFWRKKTPTLKPWHGYVLAIVIIVAAGYRFYQNIWPKADVVIGNARLNVLVANNELRRYRGWSNHRTMGKYSGMLFVFPDRGQHTMVMRVMRFPLDIIWLDGRTIVDMAPRLPPESNKPEAELTPYFSRAPATLVLELPAGFIEEHKLKIGEVVEIIE